MTATDDPLLDALTRANPYPRETIPDAAADPDAWALLAAITAQPPPPGRPRRSRSRTLRRALVPVASLVIIAVVVAVIVHAGASRRAGTATTPGGPAPTEVELALAPTPEVPRVTTAAVDREIAVLSARIRSLGVTGARITRTGDTLIVHSRQVAASAKARRLLTENPQLEVTDWEANVLTANGQTAASQLLGQNPAAMLLSQGQGNAGAGGASAGAMTLYAAVRLASQQPARLATTTQTRRGPQSYAFAAPGSNGCPSAGAPCWAAGPSASSADAVRAARRAGVADPRVLTVPQGTVVVEAINARHRLTPDYRDRAMRYFVLRDDAALTGLQARDVRRGRAGGAPDVDISLTAAGDRAFESLTAVVAHRGANLQVGTADNYQHVAVILDGRILTVPYIDYHSDPDGVIASHTGALDIADAPRGLLPRIEATLRLGTLPLGATISR